MPLVSMPKQEIRTELDYMKKALELGYANYYDWTTNNEARINVAPLRKDERFRQLLHQYLHIFNS